MARFSIYSSAFNLIKNKFDFKSAILNFSEFADEVVIAVNKSSDGTIDEIKKFIKENGIEHVKILDCDISYDDPFLDGALKNEALQSTTMPLKIGLDMDERIPLYQKDAWESFGKILLNNNRLDSLFIPSVNLWGSELTIKDDKDFNFGSFKWYLHKDDLFRGAWNGGFKKDGSVDTSKSDTCELIDFFGELSRSSKVFQPSDCKSYEDWFELCEKICIFHLGYISYEDRLVRNKNFWSEHWLLESGGEKPPHKVHELLEDFDEQTIKHNIKLWNER